MEARIHQSKIWEIMERKDKAGNPIPFSFQYAKMDGTLKTYENAVLSSIYSKGATVNIITKGDNKPHTFRKILIIKINNKKVYI